MNILFYLIAAISSYAEVIDFGPVQDSLGHSLIDIYDNSGNQRGTNTNPLFSSITNFPATQTISGTINSIPVDGNKATYSAAFVALAGGSITTDLVNLSGSASKTIRIVRLTFSATQTTAAMRDILLIKRSTANNGGASSNASIVPNDSTSVAATAIFKGYTTNAGSLGTAVGTMRAWKSFISTTAAAPTIYEWKAGEGPSQAIILRGANESLSLNLNAVASAGLSADVWVEWTEE